MTLMRSFVVLAALAGPSLGAMPDFYKQLNSVVWVVKSIDHPLQGWARLGLSDVKDYGNLTFDGQYLGNPVTIEAQVATGKLGNLTVHMVHPAKGENAFTQFLSRHGDGIFSLVHEVASMEQMTAEIQRMRGLGVGVLQRIAVSSDNGPITLTFFDTEQQGKYVLGLIHWPGGAPAAGAPGKISHVAIVAREAEGPSAYWEKLGFPAMPKSHASPREDSRYHGKPLLLDFDVCWQRHTQLTYEWIIPPNTPPNVYADFLKSHGEGVQHLGVPVEDLKKSIAEYTELGYSAAQCGAWGDVGKKDSGQYCYMDTDSIGGVSAEVIKAYH